MRLPSYWGRPCRCGNFVARPPARGRTNRKLARPGRRGKAGQTNIGSQVVSVLALLLVGLIVVMPAITLGLLLPGWLASLIGLPIGAWLAWRAYQALSESG